MLVLAAWIASFIGLTRLALGFIHMRRLVRTSVPLNDESLCKLFAELKSQCKIARPVALRESPQLSVAATVGWRRPLVLLPPSWHTWTPDERRAVLAHELAHVRQRHYPTWIIGQLAVVAHFYHPLVHWLARRLRFEQELAADAFAAATFADRRQYAAVLASLALGPTRSHSMITPIGLFMSRPILMRRIAMLRQTNDTPTAKSGWKVRFRIALDRTGRGRRSRPAGLSGSPEIGRIRGRHRIECRPADAHRSNRNDARGCLVQSRGREVNSPLGEKHSFSDAAWNTYCRTQIAAIKSTWVLQAALRDEKIASLPLLKSQPQPVSWLQQHVQVGFDSGSEIMYVLMYCPPPEVDQTVPARRRSHKSLRG